MSSQGKAILAAGLLAVLTMFVFATLRNTGPVAAVRQYNEALIGGDPREIAEYSSGTDRESWGTLANEVRSLLLAGAKYQVRERTPSTAPDGSPETLVQVVYVRGTMRLPMVYACEKGRDGRWRINVDRTLFLLYNALRA